jgi:hypothetical protein
MKTSGEEQLREVRLRERVKPIAVHVDVISSLKLSNSAKTISQ